MHFVIIGGGGWAPIIWWDIYPIPPTSAPLMAMIHEFDYSYQLSANAHYPGSWFINLARVILNFVLNKRYFQFYFKLYNIHFEEF